MRYRSILRTSPLLMAALAACVNADLPPAEPSVALHAATPDEQTEAVLAWSDRASTLAIIEIEAAQAIADGDRIHTEAVLLVHEVYRDELGLDLTAGQRLWVEIPGGQIGERSELSSAAPLLFEGDTVLAMLGLDEDDNITFDGHNSVLPVRDGALSVCVNPDPGTVLRCIDGHTTVIAVETLPLFTGADEPPALPLSQLRGHLL